MLVVAHRASLICLQPFCEALLVILVIARKRHHHLTAYYAFTTNCAPKNYGPTFLLPLVTLAVPAAVHKLRVDSPDLLFRKSLRHLAHALL